MRKIAVPLILSVVLLLASCASKKRFVAPDTSNPRYTVAVLPLYNATADIEGAERVREEFFRRLGRFHYSVMPLEEVDRLLRDRLGVTLGSQLELATPEETGKALGVHALVYGYLLDYSHVTLGIYNVKKVRAGFRLVDAETGRTVWARGHGVKSILTGSGLGDGVAAVKELQDGRDGLEDFKSIKGIDEIPGLTDWYTGRIERVRSAGNAAVLSLGEKFVEKALRVHLKAEVHRMLDIIMSDFPAGPGP